MCVTWKLFAHTGRVEKFAEYLQNNKWGKVINHDFTKDNFSFIFFFSSCQIIQNFSTCSRYDITFHMLEKAEKAEVEFEKLEKLSAEHTSSPTEGWDCEKLHHLSSDRQALFKKPASHTHRHALTSTNSESSRQQWKIATGSRHFSLYISIGRIKREFCAWHGVNCLWIPVNYVFAFDIKRFSQWKFMPYFAVPLLGVVSQSTRIFELYVSDVVSIPCGISLTSHDAWGWCVCRFTYAW